MLLPQFLYMFSAEKKRRRELQGPFVVGINTKMPRRFSHISGEKEATNYILALQQSVPYTVARTLCLASPRLVSAAVSPAQDPLAVPPIGLPPSHVAVPRASTGDGVAVDPLPARLPALKIPVIHVSVCEDVPDDDDDVLIR